MRPIDFFEEKKSYPCQKRVPPHAFNGTKRSYRQKRKYVSINSTVHWWTSIAKPWSCPFNWT